MNDAWIQAQKFILSLKEGDEFYMGEEKLKVLKVTNYKISLSINNKPFDILKKHYDEFFYFHSKGIRIRNKNYPLVNQLIRNVEGYIVYLSQIHILDKKEKKFLEILNRSLTN